MTERERNTAAGVETGTGGGTGGREAGTEGAETEGINTRNTQYTKFTRANKNGIESRIFLTHAAHEYCLRFNNNSNINKSSS